jgi:hypothetical protein
LIPDTETLSSIWKDIISEVGIHYGDRLAGWWFDEGSTGYYYRSPAWELLARAAKAGFPATIPYAFPALPAALHRRRFLARIVNRLGRPVGPVSGCWPTAFSRHEVCRHERR